jgi:hypothetical protein
VDDDDINMKYFLKGIDDFGEPTLTDDPVDDQSSFYTEYFMRCHRRSENPANKQSLSEGGGNPKKRPLAEEQDRGNQQAVKKRAIQKEKATTRMTTGNKTTTKTTVGKKSTRKNRAAEMRKKGARKNAGKR